MKTVRYVLEYSLIQNSAIRLDVLKLCHDKLEGLGEFSFFRCLIVCEVNHEQPLLIGKHFG